MIYSTISISEVLFYFFYPRETRVVKNTDTPDIIKKSFVHIYNFFPTDF